jgi:hypothetical protein
MASGLAFLAVSNAALPLAAQEKKTAPQAGGGEDFWKRVDQSRASVLARNAIEAARAQVQSQRRVNAAKRAEVLVGPDAGKEHLAQARAQYAARTAALGRCKQALAGFVKSKGEAGNKRFSEFAAKGGLKELAAKARKTSIQAMLHSEISPAEAQSAVKALDERLGKIQSLSSFQDLTSYLDQHLDELIARKMPEEDPNGLCVLILILTSIFAVLVVVAVIICIFTLGLGCQNILDNLLAQACP